MNVHLTSINLIYFDAEGHLISGWACAFHEQRCSLGRPIGGPDRSRSVLRRSCDRTTPLRRKQEQNLSQSDAQPSDCDSSYCSKCPKREHRVNVAFQLPPGTIATSIGRHTVRRSVSERRSRADREQQ
jgi:hypothetical protein